MDGADTTPPRRWGRYPTQPCHSPRASLLLRADARYPGLGQAAGLELASPRQDKNALATTVHSAEKSSFYSPQADCVRAGGLLKPCCTNATATRQSIRGGPGAPFLKCADQGPKLLSIGTLLGALRVLVAPDDWYPREASQPSEPEVSGKVNRTASPGRHRRASPYYIVTGSLSPATCQGRAIAKAYRAGPTLQVEPESPPTGDAAPKSYFPALVDPCPASAEVAAPFGISHSKEYRREPPRSSPRVQRTELGWAEGEPQQIPRLSPSRRAL